MDSLYKYLIIENDINSYSVKVSFADETHSIFKAHFPSNSLLPGFLHLDIVADILSKEIVSIQKAKFLNPILPNDVVMLFINIKENIVTAIFKKNTQKCSEMKFAIK